MSFSAHIISHNTLLQIHTYINIEQIYTSLVGCRSSRPQCGWSMPCDVAGGKLSVVGDDCGSSVVRTAVTDICCCCRLTLCNVTGLGHDGVKCIK